MKFNSYLLVLITLFSQNLYAAGFLPEETVYSGSSVCQIQDLKEGDEATSFDGERLVSDQVIKNEIKHCYSGIKIIFEKDDLTVTPDQLLYLPKIKSWVAAKDLKPDDLVLSIKGDLVPVISTEQIKKAMQVHDITVRDQHNFFASKLGILVHNEPVTLAIVGATALELIAAYGAEAAVIGTVGYFAAQELSKPSDSPNTAFPTRTAHYTEADKGFRFQMEQEAERQKRERESHSEEYKFESESQTKKAEVKKVVNHKANPAPANPLNKNEAAGKISEALGTKKPDKGVLEAGGKQVNLGKPVDKEEFKKTDEVEKKDNEEKDKEPIVKTVEDLQKEAAISSKQSTKSDNVKQYEKPGGYDKAKEDFEALNPSNVKEHPNGTTVGMLSGGRIVNVRENSKETRPTLEIKEGKKSIKFRYDK